MKHRHMCILLALALVVFLGATCRPGGEPTDESTGGDDDDHGDHDDDDQSPDTEIACSRAVVSAGFGLAWKRLNHRVSLAQIAPAQPACPSQVPADVPLLAGLVGGNWSTGETLSDVPILDYRYFAVDAPGRLGFVEVRAELWLDAPVDEAATTVEVSLAARHMTGFSQYIVLLNGFELRTDVDQIDPAYPAAYDPALGYTSRGVGAGVGDLVIAGDTARFSVWARNDLGPADRADMNAAVARARTRAVVTALLVGLNGAPTTSIDHGYYLEYPPSRPLFQPKQPHADYARRRLDITGMPGFARAFVALQSFDFRLFGSVGSGDYLREASVQARLVNYDPATGHAVVDLDGYATNASLLTYEDLENDFNATVVLVQLPTGEATAGRKQLEFATGRESFALP